MRSLAVLLLLATAALARADVEFVRVWPAWREAASFERISEYFDGKENPGSQVLLRTQPDSRAGYYFLARLRNTGAAAAGAKLVLTLVKPDSPKPRAYTFPLTLPAGQTVYNVGLTGDDWVGPTVHPVAWKIEVFTPDGRLLAAQKSYLWEKPAQ